MDTDDGAGCEAGGSSWRCCAQCPGSWLETVPDGDLGISQVTELCQVTLLITLLLPRGGGRRPEPPGLIQLSAKGSEEKLGLPEVRPGGAHLEMGGLEWWRKMQGDCTLSLQEMDVLKEEGLQGENQRCVSVCLRAG